MTERKVSELMATKLIPEILNEISICKKNDEIKNLLKKNGTPAFLLVLKYVFYPGVEFDITEIPTFKPDIGAMGMSPNSLFMEMRRFYIFSKTTKLPIEKKRSILMDILESVHPKEAELVGKILKRDLGIPKLTYKLVQETFPNLLPKEIVKNES